MLIDMRAVFEKFEGKLVYSAVIFRCSDNQVMPQINSAQILQPIMQHGGSDSWQSLFYIVNVNKINSMSKHRLHVLFFVLCTHALLARFIDCIPFLADTV